MARRHFRAKRLVNIITLTTDFGGRDWFVGTLKGVIAGIQPKATVIDLTHEVPAQDVRAGAFALLAGYRYFPPGTIHLVVVDPGVGSGRAAIVVETADYWFVGPDNGVLSWALAGEKLRRIRRLENPRYFLREVSATFHARDVFAPVAAHLSKGVRLERLGPAITDYERLEWPKPRKLPRGWAAAVVYIDRFGNAITSLGDAQIQGLGPCWIEAGGKNLGPLRSFYQAVPAGEPLALVGSTGLLEIAINGGSAAETLKLKIGDEVRCLPADAR